jgi:Glycosyl hydrolases family 35/Beta-galactosidase jelly roll domain
VGIDQLKITKGGRVSKKSLTAGIIGLLIATAGVQAADVPRITYDKQCFTINGKDLIIYSGAFHYFRCPKPLWPERFAAIKAAGMNTVETYVAWNWHEQQPPTDVDDYSKLDMTDLSDWLKMAIDDYGLNVIIRPGPYICAEWDGGGYPQWLTTKKPANFQGMWYRGDDATYLAWCKHWFTAVAKVAAPWQITHQPEGKPGIILWQIENEYNYDRHPATVKLHQLQALAHDSRDLGIDVPLLTCVTSDPLFRSDPFLMANVWDTRNEYPKFNMTGFVGELDHEEVYQPDKPRGITELQGGWFAQVGGKLSDQQGFNDAHILHITLLAWADGITSTNYYMMFGGTNSGDWAAHGITTTYDYDAPVRESGGVDARYLKVSAMGHFLADHGAELARTTPQKITTNAPTDVRAIMRQAADGSRYLFLFNNSQAEEKHGTLTVNDNLQVQYDLGKFDAKILYLPAGVTDASAGQWLPKPVDPPQRPTSVPATIVIDKFSRQSDPGPQQWQPMVADGGVEGVGIYDRRYVYYHATVPAAADDKPRALLIKPDLSDSLIAEVDGKRLSTIQSNVDTTAFDLSPLGTAGGTITLLYENPGRPNGGEGMEAPCGPLELKIVNRSSIVPALHNWLMKIVSDDGTADVAANVDDSSWQKIDASTRLGSVTNGQKIVFRNHIARSEDDLKSENTVVSINRLAGPAIVFVNGKQVGLSDVPNISLKIDASAQLQQGDNVVALIMSTPPRRGEPARGVEMVSATPQSTDTGGSVIAWNMSGQPAGVAGQWWLSQFDDSGWESAAPSHEKESTPPGQVGLTWYRMKFDLPAADPHVWIPWNLNLDASGNGFIYLNGHFLGRWWQIGPQRSYYLPECWLNFGPGQSNVVTMCLRPTDTAAKLNSAEVSPQQNLSEIR